MTRALLLMADISGFTNFMKLHAVSTSHAQQIIVRLLKAIMKAARPPLKIAEIEGDAVFFYAPSGENNLPRTASLVKEQIPVFQSTFNREVAVLNNMNMCVCDACTRVADLKLKQVVHTGEIGIERIGNFEKLFGLDVIVVHRMLKNSVPAREYVMMTDQVFRTFADFFGLEPERRVEVFEGVGEVETVVFYAEHLPAIDVVSKVDRLSIPFAQKLGWLASITPRTLRDLVTPRSSRSAVQNLPA
jgi:hypothetical protein